jgi:hypothetical protein
MENPLITKLFFSMIAFSAAAIALMVANESASLSKAACGSYYDLNSIIAKSSSLVVSRWSLNGIPKQSKLKIINLIERLAQTEITVWCLDFFPLNNNEFHLFIAAVASNFFLFIDVFKLK